MTLVLLLKTATSTLGTALMTDPTPTDLRALCTRMADELDHYRQLLMDDRRETHALATEARAALARWVVVSMASSIHEVTVS